MECELCKGTGELDQLGQLDCPACDAATQRAALNDAVKALPPTPTADLLWYCYQAGVRAERERVKKLLDESQ